MVRCECRHRKVSRVVRIDPTDLFDLGAWRDRPGRPGQQEEIGDNAVIRFVRRKRFERAERFKSVFMRLQADLFIKLTHQRGNRSFPAIDLAARLHENRAAPFAHQQHVAIFAGNQRRCDPYRLHDYLPLHDATRDPLAIRTAFDMNGAGRLRSRQIKEDTG